MGCWSWKNFYRRKTPTFLKKGDIEKVLVSYKIYFSEENHKYFIGYLYNDHEVKHYVKNCDGQAKRMYFLIEDDDFSEKHNIIWNKLNADIEKEFDIKPVYNRVLFENQNKISLQGSYSYLQ